MEATTSTGKFGARYFAVIVPGFATVSASRPLAPSEPSAGCSQDATNARARSPARADLAHRRGRDRRLARRLISRTVAGSGLILGRPVSTRIPASLRRPLDDHTIDIPARRVTMTEIPDHLRPRHGWMSPSGTSTGRSPSR